MFFLNARTYDAPLYGKTEIHVNPASLFINYNKKAQRFCRTTKTYTPRHTRMGKAAKAQAAATAGGEGTQGTELGAMSSLECFAKHEIELEQMVLGHQRGLGTTHACLPNELSTVVLKNWYILLKSLALCSLTLKI